MVLKKCLDEILKIEEGGRVVAKRVLKKRWELVFICAKFSLLNPGLYQEKRFLRSGISMKLNSSEPDLRTMSRKIVTEPFYEVTENSIFKPLSASINTTTCVLLDSRASVLRLMILYLECQNESVFMFLKIANKIYFPCQIKLKNFKSYLKNNKKFYFFLKKKKKIVSMFLRLC